MSSQIKLQQPVINGSLRSTNFFNGRLVTGSDMSREQAARRDGDRRIGKAFGDGIAYGLKVGKKTSSGNEVLISVEKGLAVSRCGQTLFLGQDTTIDLLQRFGSVETASKTFANCQPVQPGTYAAGYGLYLLVISPAETSEGSAPTGGLNNSVVTCNKDTILETVQFRLHAIDPFLKNETLPSTDKFRNYIAYRCFGTAQTKNFFKNPLGFSLEKYGLIDEMRKDTLSDSEVPLAIINWTSGGLQYIEMWSVRRRINHASDDKNWTKATDDRRLGETEAMMRQFANQIEDAEPEKNNYQAIRAADFFRFLPPAGIIPQASTLGGNGFDLNNFFQNRRLDDIAMIDGEQLQPLLREALTHEPIDLDSDEEIQIYFVRENFEAVRAGQIKQFSVVFAKRTIPYYGKARFNAELSNWNLSRYV